MVASLRIGGLRLAMTRETTKKVVGLGTLFPLWRALVFIWNRISDLDTGRDLYENRSVVLNVIDSWWFAVLVSVGCLSVYLWLEFGSPKRTADKAGTVPSDSDGHAKSIRRFLNMVTAVHNQSRLQENAGRTTLGLLQATPEFRHLYPYLAKTTKRSLAQEGVIAVKPQGSEMDGALSLVEIDIYKLAKKWRVKDITR